MEEEEEKKVRELVLNWCRKSTGNGLPCMRQSSPYMITEMGRKPYYVCDNSLFSSPILYEGDSWEEIWKMIAEDK